MVNRRVFEMPRMSWKFLTIVPVICFVPFALAVEIMGASVNVEVRFEGPRVSPNDTIHGLDALVAVNSPVKFILSLETDVLLDAGTLGFRIYSPDESSAAAEWLTGIIPLGAWASEETWTLSGPLVDVRLFDGALPDIFLIGGVVHPLIGGGYAPAAQADIVSVEGRFLVDNSIICIDTTFVPPAGEWLMSFSDNKELIRPTWGASEGGYPDGGLCFTVSCCLLAGDANLDGRLNIADVMCQIGEVFGSSCNRETDACLDVGDVNGSGMVDIADVISLINYLFAGGQAPRCIPSG